MKAIQQYRSTKKRKKVTQEQDKNPKMNVEEGGITTSQIQDRIDDGKSVMTYCSLLHRVKQQDWIFH